MTRDPAARSRLDDATTSPATSLPEMCGSGIVTRRQAAPLPEVEMIQRAGADAHQHLARRRHRIRRVLVAQDLGAAVLMEANRAHGKSGSDLDL